MKASKIEPKDVTRYVTRITERELWARAAGRCQFAGCNRHVYKSPVTQEPVNISEKAHIYSFSQNGPRGWGPFTFNRKGINDVHNLMLVCHDCHSKIDNEPDGGRYTSDLLISWKAAHEKRIAIVTGIAANKKSNVVLYWAPIGKEKLPLEPQAAMTALFPGHYPAEEHPISLSMSWEGKDSKPDYWTVESGNLNDAFQRFIVPNLERGDHPHFSIFGFAPIPLLVQLGVLFTDKVNCSVYQLQREPEKTWNWPATSKDITYKVVRPADHRNPPVLVLSLSGIIDPERIYNVTGREVSLWEVTIDGPNNDFIKSRQHLSDFRTTIRALMVEISAVHGNTTPLSIFPAIPLSCAIELGRIRMPKSEMPWLIFDQNNAVGKFMKTLEIK